MTACRLLHRFSVPLLLKARVDAELHGAAVDVPELGGHHGELHQAVGERLGIVPHPHTPRYRAELSDGRA